MQLIINEIREHTWSIDEEGVRFFLLEGDETSLLIDCGLETRNALEVVGKLTDRPVKLILTHADRDHAGSINEFKQFYMHASEASNFYNTNHLQGDFIPVQDGEILDLGNRQVRVILTPGHTPGSIALLDINNRILFSGDPVQDGNIFMFGVQREMHAYRKSLKKLMNRQEEFDEVYPSHGTMPLGKGMISKLYDVSGKVMKNEFQGVDAEVFGMKVKIVDTGVAKYLLDIE